MRVAHSLLNGLVSLGLLGALVLMGMGASDACAPSSSVAPSGVHQTSHVQAPSPASINLWTHGTPLPAIGEVSMSRQAEMDDQAGSPHLSPAATSHSLASLGQIRSVNRARALLRRLCVVLCVFLC